MLSEKLSRRNAAKSNDVQIQKRRVRYEYGTPKGVRKLELSRTINISLLRSEAPSRPLDPQGLHGQDRSRCFMLNPSP